MKVVIQRVSQAEVSVDEVSVGKITKGFMILIGIHELDTRKDVSYLVRKISRLRVFEDDQGKMNKSITDIDGSILSISQFTLYAETKKGNRPSFINAARSEVSNPLYEEFNQGLRNEGIVVETGKFGADMQVALVNDGPVTIVMDTKENND